MEGPQLCPNPVSDIVTYMEETPDFMCVCVVQDKLQSGDRLDSNPARSDLCQMIMCRWVGDISLLRTIPTAHGILPEVKIGILNKWIGVCTYLAEILTLDVGQKRPLMLETFLHTLNLIYLKKRVTGK